jgi:hypothetical protein
MISREMLKVSRFHPTAPFAAPAEACEYVTPKIHWGDEELAGRLAAVVFP